MVDSSKKKQLDWQCRRGMLELDLLLQNFLEKHLDTLTAQQLTTFEALLTYSDPQLYAWLMGQEEPTDNELQHIVAILRA